MGVQVKSLVHCETLRYVIDRFSYVTVQICTRMQPDLDINNNNNELVLTV